MKKRMRKAVKQKMSSVKDKGMQLMNAAKQRINMEVAALTKAGILTQKDAKKLLAEFIRELNVEKERFMTFAQKELTSAATKLRKKAIPVARKAISNYKKVRFKSKTAKKTTKRRKNN